jgi:hypothetical protein
MVYYKPFPKEMPAAEVRDDAPDVRRCVGLVTCIHTPTCVNLTVFDANGCQHSETSVTYVPPGEKPQQSHGYAEDAEGLLDRLDDAEAEGDAPPAEDAPAAPPPVEESTTADPDDSDADLADLSNDDS